MSDVSKISIDGTAYNIKDATARENAQNATKMLIARWKILGAPGKVQRTH